MWNMWTSFALVATCYLSLVAGDVVTKFQDVAECQEFFHQGRIPDLGQERPGVVHICQRFLNQYHFATLYDTHNRIAVYSAYIFEPSNGGGREKRWFVEPQASVLFRQKYAERVIDYIKKYSVYIHIRTCRPALVIW